MRARALFAKLPDEAQPILVAALDETLWEHDDGDDWARKRKAWPDEYEWVEAWVVFDDDLGCRLFPSVPEVCGNVEADPDNTGDGRDLARDLHDLHDLREAAAHVAALDFRPTNGYEQRHHDQLLARLRDVLSRTDTGGGG